MSARVETQREDVASLFRKFGGDASEYREFAPVATPAAPVVEAPPIAAPAVRGISGPPAAPAGGVAAAAPAAWTAPAVPAVSAVPQASAVAAIATEPTGVAPLAASSAAPRELDVIFQRLASRPSASVPASGLMAVWRRST